MQGMDLFVLVGSRRKERLGNGRNAGREHPSFLDLRRTRSSGGRSEQRRPQGVLCAGSTPPLELLQLRTLE